MPEPPAALAEAHAGPESASREDEQLLFEPLTQAEVHNCAFSSWYPRLRRVAFDSAIIKPLEHDFVDYLLADGIFVPGQADWKYHGEIEEHGSSGSEWSDSDDEGAPGRDAAGDSDSDSDAGSGADNGQRAACAPGVGRTTADIAQRIEELGGEVFPRMGWSAPTDAAWAGTTGTLKCRSVPDIYFLLKSSDKIARDLTAGRYGLPPDDAAPELVLRKWANLLPAMMFRCFVKDRRLRAISQLDYHHHDYLDEMRDEITAKLTQLFDAHVAPSFASENYCFDAYIAKTRDKTYVIDFEPWTASVDSCLFEWRELAAGGSDYLGLRLFPKDLNGMAHFSAKHVTNRFPTELAGDSRNDTLVALIERLKRETAKNTP